MIESCYWKDELARIAKTLRPSRRPRRVTERVQMVTERDIMVGFFLLRRLIEWSKVSTATRDRPMRVFCCRSREKNVHRLNAHDLYELYDLEKEQPQTKKPMYISNQFIHAYTGGLYRDKSRNWSDFYIVSDFDRNDCIWRIPASEIRSVFTIAAKDYPNVAMKFNTTKGDYDIVTN